MANNDLEIHWAAPPLNLHAVLSRIQTMPYVHWARRIYSSTSTRQMHFSKVAADGSVLLGVPGKVLETIVPNLTIADIEIPFKGTPTITCEVPDFTVEFEGPNLQTEVDQLAFIRKRWNEWLILHGVDKVQNKLTRNEGDVLTDEIVEIGHGVTVCFPPK